MRALAGAQQWIPAVTPQSLDSVLADASPPKCI